MKLFWWTFFLFCNYSVTAQDTIPRTTGPKIIRTIKDYVSNATQKPGMVMDDLKKYIPGLVLELRYAGTDNFTGQRIYPATRTTYLRRIARKSLSKVQRQLRAQGLGLKIFDAYRPYSATELIWNLVKDESYAANPAKGSNHNRGIAIDVTIIDSKTKEELNMGTTFDNFSDTAHHSFRSLPDTVLKNRLLLRKVMEQNGFTAMETEWWHYSLPDPGKYGLLDLSFEQLEKLSGSSIKSLSLSVAPASSGRPTQRQ